ncbi:MAG: GNAT family N-acetyltransferase [Verrucomicrobia bacterium]|nr:MAG: GNAT family N-acetyltransferase [Verrucomicrobiota bacterium]TAE86206.1 MAG: GNAT family N-acetyltransferase [Verrucomicrobiota bacterium]TAF23652.1 MAG: GNAT family N-acetyltransferase [Verrucomicrobiota bacterium]TAF40195.1 MAG: GNAT family N-acetyltransferase [Verrucomicrobiota bacterium]
MSSLDPSITSRPVLIRNPTVDDIPAILALHRRCFPEVDKARVAWGEKHLRSHLNLFPEGQFLAERDGTLLGVASSLIVSLGRDPLRKHTYDGITDTGFFYNHDPQGDTLYGADIYVDPDARKLGIGAALYDARRALCRSLNLRRILAGVSLQNYDDHAPRLTPDAYIRQARDGKIVEPLLAFQLKQGFVVRGIMPDYLPDHRSHDHAAMMEWIHPGYQSREEDGKRVRVACVQYQMRKVGDFDEFAKQVRYFVETAGEDYGAEFVLFPEFLSVQLLSTLEPLGSREGIRRLADYTPRFIALMSDLAREQGLYLIAGSHPVLQPDGRLENTSMIFKPDGTHVSQPKLHITPSEKTWWGISGGDSLIVLQTPKAKIGVLICYDVEFPETARYLADQGVEILFVPYCTDNRQGYLRVSLCAAARAIENQIYVATAGVIGNLPDVPAMDIHYGRAAVFTPSDFEFARDGIQAEADPNVETMLITDLDISNLYRSRLQGSVTPLTDRRRDLFEFHHKLSNETIVANSQLGQL